jgi:hypothetical protein
LARGLDGYRANREGGCMLASTESNVRELDVPRTDRGVLKEWTHLRRRQSERLSVVDLAGAGMIASRRDHS